MESMNRSTAGLTRRSLSALLVVAVLFAPAAATEAAAQSDAGTVNATVTVQAEAISVTGVQDLVFGTHFASEGVVANEQPAVWQIDVSTDPTSVDFSFTVLPTELLDDVFIEGVPLAYGPESFGAQCAGILFPADPVVGLQNCDIIPGAGFATLGDVTLGLDPVQVDLSSAIANEYSATIELTATIN